MEKINIDFSGYIQVDKNDLKIKSIEPNGDMIDIDTTKLTGDEVVALLNGGNVVLESFGETYEKYTLDGDDSFEFSVEEEDD